MNGWDILHNCACFCWSIGTAISRAMGFNGNISLDDFLSGNF